MTKRLYAHHITTINLASGDPASGTVCAAIGDASEVVFKEHGCPGNLFAFVPLEDCKRVKDVLGVSPAALARMFAQAPALRDLLLEIEGQIAAFSEVCGAAQHTDMAAVWELLDGWRDRIGVTLGRRGPVDGEPRRHCVLDETDALVQVQADRLTVTVKRTDDGVSVYVSGPDGGDITSTWAAFAEASDDEDAEAA